jgi:geranylgeranyl reductase family protein
MFNYEVIIVGAGPAGCSSALRLLNLAPHLAGRVLLLDKAVFPRAKLCAGGLSPIADRALSRLGLVGGPSGIPVHKAILILPTGRLTFEQLNLSRVVSREQFDYFLLQSARQRGVTVQDGEAVEHVLPTRDEVIVRTSRDEYRTKILIAADGANSRVRRRLGLNRAGRVMAAMELHAPLADISVPNLEENMALLDMSLMNRGVPGYGWVFPAVAAGSHPRSVGILAAPFGRGGGTPLRDAFASWLATIGLDLNACEAKAHPILRYDPQAACSRRRVLLVGDAAGIDPLFGEGISSALAQGIIAAQSAFEALRDHDFSFSNYERRIRDSDIGSMMYRRHLVARKLYSHPKLAQFLLRRRALLQGLALLRAPQSRVKLTWEPLTS